MIKIRIGNFQLPSMIGWLASIAILLTVVWLTSPQNLKIIPYKMALVCIAAYMAHRLDRTFFGDKYGDHDLARAVVFVGVVLGLTLGL